MSDTQDAYDAQREEEEKIIGLFRSALLQADLDWMQRERIWFFKREFGDRMGRSLKRIAGRKAREPRAQPQTPVYDEPDRQEPPPLRTDVAAVPVLTVPVPTIWRYRTVQEAAMHLCFKTHLPLGNVALPEGRPAQEIVLVSFFPRDASHPERVHPAEAHLLLGRAGYRAATLRDTLAACFPTMGNDSSVLEIYGSRTVIILPTEPDLPPALALFRQYRRISGQSWYDTRGEENYPAFLGYPSYDGMIPDEGQIACVKNAA